MVNEQSVFQPPTVYCMLKTVPRIPGMWVLLTILIQSLFNDLHKTNRVDEHVVFHITGNTKNSSAMICIHPAIHICLSISLSIHLSINPVIPLSIHPSIHYKSICLSQGCVIKSLAKWQTEQRLRSSLIRVYTASCDTVIFPTHHLTLLHSEGPKLHGFLALLSAIGLKFQQKFCKKEK